MRTDNLKVPSYPNTAQRYGSDLSKTAGQSNRGTVHGPEEIPCSVPRASDMSGGPINQTSVFCRLTEVLAFVQQRVYLAVESSLERLVKEADKVIEPAVTALNKVLEPVDHRVSSVAEPAGKILVFGCDSIINPPLEKAEGMVCNFVNNSAHGVYYMARCPGISSVYLTNLGLMLLYCPTMVVGAFKDEATTVHNKQFEVSTLNHSNKKLHLFSKTANGGRPNAGGKQLCDNYAVAHLEMHTQNKKQIKPLYFARNTLKENTVDSFIITSGALPDVNVVNAAFHYGSEALEAARQVYLNDKDDGFDDGDVTGLLYFIQNDETPRYDSGSNSGTADLSLINTAATEYLSGYFRTQHFKHVIGTLRDYPVTYNPRYSRSFENANAALKVNGKNGMNLLLPKFKLGGRHQGDQGKVDRLYGKAHTAILNYFDAVEDGHSYITDSCQGYLKNKYSSTTKAPTTPAPTTPAPTTPAPTTPAPTTWWAGPTTPAQTTLTSTTSEQTTAEEFDREFGTDSSTPHNSSSLLSLPSQYPKKESSDETVRNIVIGVTSAVGFLCLGLGLTFAAIFHVKKRWKPETQKASAPAAPYASEKKAAASVLTCLPSSRSRSASLGDIRQGEGPGKCPFLPGRLTRDAATEPARKKTAADYMPSCLTRTASMDQCEEIVVTQLSTMAGKHETVVRLQGSPGGAAV